jgi:hypothetical protein
MNAILPLPMPLSVHEQKRRAYQAKRAANQAVWGIASDGTTSAHTRTRTEAAEAAKVVIPQVPVVHRQVIEAAPEYEECMSCQ